MTSMIESGKETHRLRPRTLSLVGLLIAVSFLGGACFKKGKTIETIGNYTMTTHDFNQFYGGRLELTSRTRRAQFNRKRLSTLLCNPRDETERRTANELDPKINYEAYRQMRIIEQAAIEDGFLDRPLIKRMIQTTVLQMVTQLYIQEQLNKHVKITPAMKEKRCTELRKKYPNRVGALLLDRCLEVAERSLRSQFFRENHRKVQNEIRERIQVKLNAKFDKDQFLKSQVTAYEALKKLGGCAGKPTGSSSESGTGKGKGTSTGSGTGTLPGTGTPTGTAKGKGPTK